MNNDSHQSPGRPSPSDVLGWIAQAGSSGWFPAVEYVQHQCSRDTLYENTLDLLRLELIEVVDWIRGKGQGFAITDLGKQKLGLPIPAAAPVKAVQVVRSMTTYERGEQARQALAYPQPSVMALGIMLICVIWYLVGLSIAFSHGKSMAYLGMSDSESILKIGAAYGPYLYAGGWWRLLTSAFVHIGIIHLVLNAYGLYVAGAFAENLWGRKKFLVIYLTSALGGSIFATAMRPEAVFAGASGGIWGALTSIIAWFFLNREHLQQNCLRHYSYELGMCVILNGILSLFPGISWEGHLAGGITGFFTAYMLYSIRMGSGFRGRLAMGTLVFAAITVVLAYRFWIRNSDQWNAVRENDRRIHEVRQLIADKKNDFILKSEELTAVFSSIPFTRVEMLYKEGQFAIASGNRKKLDIVSQKAKVLYDDAGKISQLIDACLMIMIEIKTLETGGPVTMLGSPERTYFQHVASFAGTIERLTKANPPATKEWLAIDSEFKKLKTEVMAVQFDQLKPKQP